MYIYSYIQFTTRILSYYTYTGTCIGSLLCNKQKSFCLNFSISTLTCAGVNAFSSNSLLTASTRQEKGTSYPSAGALIFNGYFVTPLTCRRSERSRRIVLAKTSSLSARWKGSSVYVYIGVCISIY